MAKSWKTLIKTTDSDSRNDIGTNSPLNKIQLTLDEIAAQDEVLNNLLKERKSLENGLDSLLKSSNSETEDKRFAGSIESFKDKREKEKNRIALKKKLEERILKKNKELEKWDQNLKRLKKKLALQKKSASADRKETKQDSSTSLKALKSPKKGSEKNWFDTTKIRKKKDEIERKKKVLTDEIKRVEKLPEKIRELKTELDSFGLKDLAKFQQKLDPVKKVTEIPTRIRKIKNNWDEKRENQKEKLREKGNLKKLSEKLEEAKRFGKTVKSDIKDSLKSLESKVPEIKELTDQMDKDLDNRQMNLSENTSTKKSEEKEAEKKDSERREKLKEQFLSRKKAERKEEERSSRKKERKNEKYT